MAYGILAVFVLLQRFPLSESGCAPMRYDIAFYFVEDTSRGDIISKQKTLATNIVDKLSIGYMQTRISCHVYGGTSSKQHKAFDFKSKTTVDGIKSALNGLSYTSSGEPNTLAAVPYIWNSIFTESNGDRAGVPNYCLMIAINEQNGTGAITKNPNIPTLWIIDVQKAYYSSGDSYSEFEFSKLATPSNFYKEYTSALTSVDVGALADEFITLNQFTCNYYCGNNYFAYDEPMNLNSEADTVEGKLTLLMDSPWDVTCCGVVSSWVFYAKASGTIKIGVFRPNEATNQYVVIGYNTIIIPEIYVNTTVDYQLIPEERIAIIEGDHIGWYTDGPNIISFSACNTVTRTDCPQSTKQFSPLFDIQDGVHFDIPSDSNTITNKAYSLNFTTTNNTQMYIRTNENETELEENTAIGKHAIYLTIDDPDYENHTFVIAGEGDSLDYLDLNTDKMTLDLIAKFPKGGGGPYIVTVSGNDTCQHSATVTLTVSTYNAPPVINNLPHILEILETTRTSVPLIQINVTDATNDEICCTLPFTLPNTFNFKLVTTPVENGTDIYWLHTIDQPAFEYSDIDSFRVFVCCQDAYGSSYSYLILRLVEVKQEVPYTPPAWFFRALYLSLAPISMMTLVACFTLLYSVFWL